MRKGAIEDFFKKIEFLAWNDSPMCAESNGESFIIILLLCSNYVNIVYQYEAKNLHFLMD